MSTERDIRPADCRHRLQDEGKAYPRSSCWACGRNIMSGLGTRCYLERSSEAPAPETHLDEIARLTAALADMHRRAQKAEGEAERLRTLVAAYEAQGGPISNQGLRYFNMYRRSEAAHAASEERERRMREALEPALAALPHGVWETWTSCSFRRISRRGGGDGDVLCGTVQRSDGHPVLSWTEKQCEAICTVVNTLRAALTPEGETK